MSSFAINGRIVFDPSGGPVAFVQAIPSDAGDRRFETRRGVGNDADPRLHVLELVAALAREIRGRGDHVSALDVE